MTTPGIAELEFSLRPHLPSQDLGIVEAPARVAAHMLEEEALQTGWASEGRRPTG